MNPSRIFVLLFSLALLPIVPLRAQQQDPHAAPMFIAHDTEPVLRNAKDVYRVMRRVYPSGYRDTGLDVTTILWIYVEPDGTVGARRVLKSSGYGVFDRAAEQVVDVMVFEPAGLQGEPVGVWINKAIRFKSGESGRLLEGPALLAEEPEEPDGSPVP